MTIEWIDDENAKISKIGKSIHRILLIHHEISQITHQSGQQLR